MSFDPSEPLALHGGAPAKRTPFPARRRHGEREKQLLAEVIDSDVLFFYLGTKVRALEQRFAAYASRQFAIACSSGTAAVHIMVAALQLPPGTEIIVPPITDMGGLTGILYQGLIPVFADVEPDTLNIDPAAVERCLSPRTGAIIAVHHSGLAANLDALAAIARRAGVPLLEDCAQAYGTLYQGKQTGGTGLLSAFSLNHFKHITCGSGGAVLTDDPQLRYFCSLFLDKCYQREEGIRDPFFLAPNYQMTELQAAVSLAQFERVDEITAARHRLGTRLAAALAEIPGVSTQTIPPGSRHSYFLFLFRLHRHLLRCDAQQFSAALAAEGVPNRAHLITGGMPVYRYRIFQNRSAFPGSLYPFRMAEPPTDRSYLPGLCPVAEAAFDEWITMDLYEHYTPADIDEIAHGIAKVCYHFRCG